MNINQLRAFREVMVTGSVSKAAENLYLTQPAVSLQISRLEKRLELRLFTRNKGRLQPTPEAEYLFTQATEILEQIETVNKNLTRIRKLEVGKINIVSMVGPSFFLIPQLISDFVKERDSVKISLYSHSSFQTLQLLSAQRFDVGIVDLVPEPAPALVNYDKLEFSCLCAVPIDDPIARQSIVSPEDLDGKPLALLLENHPISNQLTALFEKLNLSINRRFETRYFIPQLAFVERGLAYAVVEPLTVESYRLYRGEQGQIKFIPFAPSITYSLSVVTPRHRPLSTLADSFVTFLKDELQAIQQAGDPQ